MNDLHRVDYGHDRTIFDPGNAETLEELRAAIVAWLVHADADTEFERITERRILELLDELGQI